MNSPSNSFQNSSNFNVIKTLMSWAPEDNEVGQGLHVSLHFVQRSRKMQKRNETVNEQLLRPISVKAH